MHDSARSRGIALMMATVTTVRWVGLGGRGAEGQRGQDRKKAALRDCMAGGGYGRRCRRRHSGCDTGCRPSLPTLASSSSRRSTVQARSLVRVNVIRARRGRKRSGNCPLGVNRSVSLRLSSLSLSSLSRGRRVPGSPLSSRGFQARAR